MILDYDLGTDYELLNDECYFSTFSRPYAFIDVTDQMNPDTGSDHCQ